MAVSRRQFLQGLGSGVTVLVAGGVYRAVDQGVFSAGRGPAYQPWQDWRTAPTEGPLRLVQAGILAANPHNMQAWLFHVTDDKIDVYVDSTRNLGTMDVYNREKIIGVGCALENMMVTAPAVGYTAQLALEPRTLDLPDPADTDPVRVATLTLSPAAPQTNPLYEAIPNRHTDRYNYDTARTIPAALLDDMTALAENETDVRLFLFRRGTDGYQALAKACTIATEMIIADEQMSTDNYVWIDQSWQEVQREKDGPYIDTAGVPPLTRVFVKMMPTTSRSVTDNGWLSGTVATMQNSDTLGFVAVRDLYDQAANLRAGRAWQRMHLWATTQGLAMQPVNQMPEVVDRDRQLNRASDMVFVMDLLTREPDWHPTFVFRMGYPTTQVLPSARRPLDEVLI